MKILHVWDQAGVACILARYQKRLGHQAEVIKREGFDKYGIEKFYGTTIYRGSPLSFYRFAIRKSRDVDVTHIHSLTKVVPLIRKPKVLHFHGSDLREAGQWRRLENYVARKSARKVIVSTPDLLSVLSNAEWLPNPVDTELFYPKAQITEPPKNLIYSRNHGYRLEENKNKTIPYSEMPSCLLEQKIYVETKPWFLSKLSLEALACGIPVVWNGLIINGKLPDIHKPKNVAKRTIEIYEGILR